VSYWIRKRISDKLPNGRPNPTLAVSFNRETESVEMWVNPRFMASLYLDIDDKAMTVKVDESRGVRYCEGVSWHEILHVVLRHIMERARQPAIAHNLATDAADNDMILQQGGLLPDGCVVPGKPWKMPIGRDKTKEEEAMQTKFSALIESWPGKQSSDWYFEQLMKFAEENGYEWGKKGLKLPTDDDGNGEFEMRFDDHDMWEDIPEEERPQVEAKLREIVKKAVRRADSDQNGWGTIPQHIRDLIRASINDMVDWEQVLAGWTGRINRGERRTSIKRINKRYPYQFPGTVRRHKPRIAVAIDQSGSVNDEWLELIFGAITKLSKRTTFDVIPFDCSVVKDGIFTWKKGTNPKLERVAQGGTDFDCITDFINSAENRGKYDGFLIMTDGGAGRPRPSRVKRGWILVPGTQLYFGETLPGETVIHMVDPKEQVKKGHRVV
jgi:predicted metal-dependent peptidase